MMPGLPMYAMPIGAPPPTGLMPAVMPMQQVSLYFILLFIVMGKL